jgi:PAS domain S-box-containing protein
MSGASVNDFENRYCRKDRSYVPVVWVAMWSEEEKLMYAIAKDRTKRQQTLEQLKYSEQNLANAQKIAMLGSWEIDFERRTVAGSEQFYKIVGKRKEEWGISVDDFYRIAHPDDETVLKIAFEKAVREEGIWDVEFRIVQGNNNVIYVHAKAQIEFNKRKQPKRFKGTIQDITQRKKVEQERELVIQELTKSNADLKQFSFITSHNFRAPLCNILGILELMDYHNLDTNNKELLEMLKAASLQLNKTIDDLQIFL